MERVLKKIEMLHFQVHDAGRLVGVGSGDGSTSLVRLDQTLINCSKNERNSALDMLEREGRKERILENRAKAIKVCLLMEGLI